MTKLGCSMKQLMQNTTNPKDLETKVDELTKQVGFLIKRTNGSSRRLLNVAEAAAYTGRSYRTFQRDVKRGLFSKIQVGGGHPKFDPAQLDKELGAWETKSLYSIKSIVN